MIKTLTGATTHTLDIDEPCMGLILENTRLTSTIKVERKRKSQPDKTVFPELTVRQYLELFGNIRQREQVTFHNATSLEHFHLPFSLNGTLMLNENDYYTVTIGSPQNNNIKVTTTDNPKYGTPVEINRLDIKDDLSEKTIDVSSYSFAFWPFEKPTKIEYQYNGRKVTNYREQMQQFVRDNRFQFYISGDDLAVVNDTLAFPIPQINNMVVHKATNEMKMYLVLI